MQSASLPLLAASPPLCGAKAVGEGDRLLPSRRERYIAIRSRLNHRMGGYNVSYSSEESTTTSVSPASAVGSALSDRMAR